MFSNILLFFFVAPFILFSQPKEKKKAGEWCSITDININRKEE
jgi:hypothetical protein